MVLAAGEIGEVLVSLGAVLLGFSWVAFTLFSPYYVGGGGGVNVDLSSFPRALQSLFVLLTAANFPDVILAEPYEHMICTHVCTDAVVSVSECSRKDAHE